MSAMPHLPGPRPRPNDTKRSRLSAILASAIAAIPAAAHAYTAAGDRTFPATIILPQIAPSDELYITPQTQPLSSATRFNDVAVNLDKTITERLGVNIGTDYSWLDQGSAGSAYGWQNLTAQLQYLAIQNNDHEFLLSLGVVREFGGTGAEGVGASGLGATTPTVFLGKGLGDVAPPYLRPLAVIGNFGYSKADGAPRPDLFTGGFALEYSIPYLESKVAAVALPEFVRALTPMVEFAFTSPYRRSFGTSTTALVAPGVTYAGEGWELGIEGQIPATRATGRGVGVIAQFHLALDYLFPETIGRPLFSP